MRLLVTRSQPNASETAFALRAHGHEPIVAPLFELEILSEVEADDGPWNAILLTSVNALWGAIALCMVVRLLVLALRTRTGAWMVTGALRA